MNLHRAYICLNYILFLFCAHTAIDYSSKLAAAQLRLETLRRRYRELLAKKEHLKHQLATVEEL